MEPVNLDDGAEWTFERSVSAAEPDFSEEWQQRCWHSAALMVAPRRSFETLISRLFRDNPLGWISNCPKSGPSPTHPWQSPIRK